MYRRHDFVPLQKHKNQKIKYYLLGNLGQITKKAYKKRPHPNSLLKKTKTKKLINLTGGYLTSLNLIFKSSLPYYKL